jgi:hypothetical protein
MNDQLPRCETCRWWEREYSDDGEWAMCGELKWGHDDVQYTAVGGAELRPAVRTHCMFGCVLHEPQPPQEGDPILVWTTTATGPVEDV